MPFPAPDGAPADVLRLFLREAPYLFFGSAFAAIGLVAGSFVAIRQRRDTLLTFFALFAILCGLRLWIQSDIVVLALGKSFLLEQLRTDIGARVQMQIRSCYQLLLRVPAQDRIHFQKEIWHQARWMT